MVLVDVVALDRVVAEIPDAMDQVAMDQVATVVLVVVAVE